MYELKVNLLYKANEEKEIISEFRFCDEILLKLIWKYSQVPIPEVIECKGILWKTDRISTKAYRNSRDTTEIRFALETLGLSYILDSVQYYDEAKVDNGDLILEFTTVKRE